MTTGQNQTDLAARGSLRMPPLLALAGRAMLYRYRAPGWRGPLFLCVSVLDVLVYALALSVVLESVFQLDGAARFVPMLIGLIALRWTLSSAIQASRVAHFAQIAEPYFRRPVLATLVLAMGPPTFVFLISVTLVVLVAVVTVRAPGDVFHMLGWGCFVTLVQLLWNSVLVMGIIQARLRRILTSEIPIVFGFTLLLIVTPVAYQFSDIPATASRILTSFNPAAHLVAAYQNAFWYLQDISLEVLPLSALLAAALLAVVLFLARRPAVAVGEQEDPTPELVAWNGTGWARIEPALTTNSMQIYGTWPNELPWISGNSFLWLIDSSHPHHQARQEVLRRLAGATESRQLLDTMLPIMSGKNRSRICVAAILPQLFAGDARPENVVDLHGTTTPLVVFDGLFDHAGGQEIQTLTDMACVENIRPLAIRTNRHRVARMLLEASPREAVVAGA